MIDVSPERSAIMAKVKGKNTKPELVVRRAAHGLGYRFRLHRRNLPGSPDLVFSGRKAVIFVHGCFWHRHVGCRKCTSPRTRSEFWQAKFEANVARDSRNLAALEGNGWRVLTIWECETRDPKALRQVIGKFLD